MKRSMTAIVVVVIMMATASAVATANAVKTKTSSGFAPVGLWTFDGAGNCETDTLAKGEDTFSGVTNDGSEVAGTISRSEQGKEVTMTWTTGSSAGAVFEATRDSYDRGYTGQYLADDTNYGSDLYPKSKLRCPLYTGAPKETSIALGANDIDIVTAVGSGHSRPLGTVEFYVCPGETSQCSSPMSVGSGSLLGSGTTSMAASPSFTPTSVGAYCFLAIYYGDGQYRNVVADSVPNQCFTVTSA